MRERFEPDQEPAAILAEDVRMDAAETWLLDDGRFLVLEDVHPAWWSSRRWRLLMRQRRVLRLFVPRCEIPKLAGVETSFKVAKRGYEIADGMRRYRDWQDGEPEGTPEEHAAKGESLLQAGFRGALAHSRVITQSAPEARFPLKTVPYAPPPVTWDEPPAGKPPAASSGKPRQEPRKK